MPDTDLRITVMRLYGRSIGNLLGLAATTATSLVVSALRVCVNVNR